MKLKLSLGSRFAVVWLFNQGMKQADKTDLRHVVGLTEAANLEGLIGQTVNIYGPEMKTASEFEIERGDLAWLRDRFNDLSANKALPAPYAAHILSLLDALDRALDQPAPA